MNEQHCDECADGWHLLCSIGAMGPGDSFETTGGDAKIMVAQIENDTVTFAAFYRCPLGKQIESYRSC